jgi:hypothetical protein
MRRALLLLALGGCELVFPLDGNTRICDPGTAFAAGEPVRLDTTDSVEAARFVPDRTIVYVSLCTGGDKALCDLYQGTYSETLDEYGVFGKLVVSDDDSYDSYPTITPDTDFILFGSQRAGGVRVYVAESSNGQFRDPMPLTVGTTGFSNEPYLLGDGQTLYLSGGPQDGKSDLFRSVGTPPTFDAFEGVSEANLAEAEEFAPVVTDDELEIFFASNRNNLADGLALDIFTSSRTTTTEPFGAPREIAALSDRATIDWPLWISPDRCDLYYINKAGDQATLFVTRR